MIARPKIKGRQSKGTIGQALQPVLAVTSEDLNPSLLPKQAEGLGLWCPKTGHNRNLRLLNGKNFLQGFDSLFHTS